MATKTYILLPHTESSANVYVQPNANQRIRLKNRPIDHAYGQVTFMDRGGKNRTIRLKLETDEIFQDVQIKDKMIPANAKFTQSERDALRFTDGRNIVENETVQKFLEASPQFEDFWLPEKDPEKKGRVGNCPDIRKPLYKLLDQVSDLKASDNMFRKRLAAGNKINAIEDIRVGQELMIRLNGAFFKAPDDILKIRDELISFLDDADEVMLDNLLKEDINIDEKVTVLIGRAIGLGIISFDKVPDQVVRISGQKVTNLKQISSTYAPEERKKYFSEFLTSEDGKLLMQDIQKAVAAADKKVEVVEA